MLMLTMSSPEPALIVALATPVRTIRSLPAPPSTVTTSMLRSLEVAPSAR